MSKYKVFFIRLDERGHPLNRRIDGYFDLEDGMVLNVSEGLSDIIENGDSIVDVKRKLRQPYFKIEPVEQGESRQNP